MSTIIYPTTNLNQIEQLRICRGDGIYVYDEDGKCYLEGLSGLWDLMVLREILLQVCRLRQKAFMK
jgi:adenosylmethionine-8-amino-7-oxononanoate aminotransferase